MSEEIPAIQRLRATMERLRSQLIECERNRDNLRMELSGLDSVRRSDNQYLLDQRDAARADLAEAVEALSGMLLSADALWESRNEGHDWPDACKAARAIVQKHKENQS